MRPPDQGTVLVVALLVGIACGLLPLIMGIAKHRVMTGVSGFVTCVVLGFLCGFLLAGPASVIFAFWIWYQGDTRSNDRAAHAGLSDADYFRERQRAVSSRRREYDEPDPRVAEKPYTAIGHVLVCNGCRQSTTKGPGGVIPAECPTCGLRFGSRSGATRRPPPRTARLAEDDVVELRVAEERRRR